MEKKMEDPIGAAAAAAIEETAKGFGIKAETVRDEIETAISLAAESGNARLQALEQANGAPLTGEDAVRAVLLCLALKISAPAAEDGQN